MASELSDSGAGGEMKNKPRIRINSNGFIWMRSIGDLTAQEAMNVQILINLENSFKTKMKIIVER